MKLPRLDRRAVSGGAAAVALTLLFGSQSVSLWLTAHGGYLVAPSAVGVPYALPGLHVTEFGDTGWTWSLWETAAALLLIGVVTARLQVRAVRLSRSGRIRAALCGWWSCVLAATAGGALRGAVTAGFAFSGAGGYLTYALFGALFGLLWGLLLGWFPGVVVLLAHTHKASPHG